MSGALLARALRAPESVARLDARGWSGLIAAARAERLIGTLADRLEADGPDLPAPVARVMADAAFDAERERRQALWEADRAWAALKALGVPVILMKGTAYVAAGLSAGRGRSIGDLDIMVPREALGDVEAALLAAGWEWVKDDPYDDQYYRRWMHELPPLIHRERDRMIDVHHTILPLTARVRPDAEAMIADSIVLDSGLRILAPADRVCHAAAHLLADGDLAGGMRNLWDIRCLLAEGGDAGAVLARAERHGLGAHVARAMRLADGLFGNGAAAAGPADRLYMRRLTARDGWGRQMRRGLRFGFYVRAHWLRMPPLMLARHLWVKWRRG